MPTEQIATEGVNAALKPDEGAVVPRMQLGEQGFVGLKTSNKRILEESQAAFRYPAFIKTVAEMKHNPTVGAALSIWRMMITRVNWDIEAPADATDVEKERVKIIRTMMDDMDGSWSSFIESIIPYLEYGFSVHEIVLRRRLKRNGSKFNDGLVGIKKLAPRSQETICGWVFDDSGAELLKVEQDISNIENSYRFQKRKNDQGKVEIERDKFLLFSASANRGNPEGNSVLKAIYLAYKRLELLQDQELLTCAKDFQGALKIGLPPRYLDVNASAEDKAVVTSFQRIIDNYSSGQQRGLLVPEMGDPETKLPLFTYELLESKGSAKIDIEATIKRLQNDILVAMSVDVLRLGAEGTGSFSLAEAKTSILALAIDYRLKEISSVLNNHLMRTLHEMNGWGCERLPKFVYADIESVDIESMGKFIQQAFSVGAVEADREIYNRVRKIFGVSPRPADEPVDVDSLPPNLTGKTTSAGKGMEVGTTGDGTSKNPFGKGDSSTSNANNK
jgi:hypothetical protein